MSRQEQLNLYIGHLQNRLRTFATLRGAVIIALVALAATLLLTLALNRYAFPEREITPARVALYAAVGLAFAVGLVLPWLRINRRSSIRKAEGKFPLLQQRLVTFAERQQTGDPFVELLAGDTLAKVQDTPASRLVPTGTLLALFAASVVFTGAVVWMATAAPGFLGYGASLLWTGPKKIVTPLYDVHVTPGDAAVRRHSDEEITAELVGLDTRKVTLHARVGSAAGWELVDMQPQAGGQGFGFTLAALPDNVEYFVEAGPVLSRHYTVRVVDLPAVKDLKVTYHYPRWTGLPQVSEEHGGDLRALEGTDAELTVTMSSPLRDGMLLLDNGQPLHLTGGEGNQYHGTIRMQKDGAYHVAASDSGQQVRLSEDYFISTEKANPPQVALDRPGADYRASPIEEVTIGVKAGADFGLHAVQLHYSVNGGAFQATDVLKQAGAKNANGTTTLNLENFKLVPGDVVSLYATAKDAHEEAKTDISFIQVDPFEREFSQSQQGGGGGGGGGGGQAAGNQSDISRREKELIAATWKQQNDKASTASHAADLGKTLSEAQVTLRQQVLALSARMESRDLNSANEEFTGFEKDMQAAAAAMVPSADKLKQQAWGDAIPNEQKALQALLRAEATFRKIQVAFGQQSGGGGGGGGSAGRDLASLFDLEMDTEKNQYETAQTGSPAEEQAKKVNDALEKLDALAKRQEELAQQQSQQAQNFQQRWQQEMLRREAEQLQREMEQMQSQQGQQGQSASGQQGSSGQSSGASGGSKQGQSQQARGQSGSQLGSQSGSSSGGQSSAQAGGQSGSKDAGADPRVQQALNRLREADEQMRRAAAPGQNGHAGAEQAREAAERLREATNLMGGAQKQQASGKLDSLARDTGKLQAEEAAEAERLRSLAASSNDSARADANTQELNRLIRDRQQLSDDVSQLQRSMREAARQLASTQPTASSKLREALGALDESGLENRVQRTADGLRRGINPNANGNEAAIASGLKSLGEGVRQAQAGMGSTPEASDKRGQGRGNEVAALDHLDRLRSAVQSLSPGTNGQPKARGSQRGDQPGQPGQAQGNSGQQGGQPAQGNQSGQPGKAGNGSGRPGTQASGRQPGQAGQGRGSQGEGQQGAGQQGSGQPSGGQQAGNASPGDTNSGGARVRAGGGGGTAIWNVNTGNNTYDRNARAQQPGTGPNPADSERSINQGMQELSRLRQLTQGDPAAAREVDALVKEMQQLDPARFPGNPQMVEQLHQQVLNDVDKLELELRRNANDPALAQVRTVRSASVPQGYGDAVAEYYRRLGKGQ